MCTEKTIKSTDQTHVVIIFYFQYCVAIVVGVDKKKMPQIWFPKENSRKQPGIRNEVD